MKPSRLNAECPALNNTANSDPAVSNPGRPVGSAGVKNRRALLKKRRLEPPLYVKPSAAFLSTHAMLSLRAAEEFAVCRMWAWQA